MDVTRDIKPGIEHDAYRYYEQLSRMRLERRAKQLGSVTLRDDRIFVAGTTPGFRAQVSADAAAPDMRESVYQTDQHNVVRAYEQSAQAQSVDHGGR